MGLLYLRRGSGESAHDGRAGIFRFKFAQLPLLGEEEGCLCIPGITNLGLQGGRQDKTGKHSELVPEDDAGRGFNLCG